MKQIWILSLAFALLSCNNQAGRDKQNTRQSKTAEPKSSKDSFKLDELLTAEMAAAILDRPAGKLDKKHNNSIGPADFHSCAYYFRTGQTKPRKVLGNTINVPDAEEVVLAQMKITSEEKFLSMYRSVSESEMAEAMKVVDRHLESVAKKQGLNDTVTHTAKKIATGLADGAVIYTDIPGVATQCRWNEKEQVLWVFQDGIQFKVSVHKGDDQQINQQKSIELARNILQKL
ncbi:MAG: hypothetical protein GXC78_00750 [Chitinophagaceae bacterium]|jgi:hypothetical protein|nr:hypothetical protein [Chitinophagaceae bacterium]